MNKKVYVVTFEMYDGEDYVEDMEIYENIFDAKEKLQVLIADYNEFWSNFDTIEQDAWHFTAFDDGWYDDAHFDIYIEEKEIKG